MKFNDEMLERICTLENKVDTVETWQLVMALVLGAIVGVIGVAFFYALGSECGLRQL